jgi:hypothetical protein
MFLDEVTRWFGDVKDDVDSDYVQVKESNVEEPSWSGWAAIQEINERYGINNINLVKPGVGETTRVLLRRVPWKVLIREDQYDNLKHIVLLAEDRGTEIEIVKDLPYSCVGIIKPKDFL